LQVAGDTSVSEFTENILKSGNCDKDFEALMPPEYTGRNGKNSLGMKRHCCWQMQIKNFMKK
jgi:DNA-directed RNA polymerase subunit N (RpoN/RPB10)